MSKLQETEAKIQGAIETVMNAVAGLVSRKNATDDQENTDASDDSAPNGYAETLKKLAKEKQNQSTGPDPAHAPGHRKLKHDGSSTHVGGKVQPANDSVVNNAAKADIIHQNESEQRRIIPGASIERKGQRR